MSYVWQTRLGLTFALLVLGLRGSAAADEPSGPLAAMREAAEALAELDPATPAVGDALRLHKSTPKAAHGEGASSAASAEALRAALRAAAREEVARDLAASNPAGHGAGIAAARGKEGSRAGADKEAREQARGAAIQAQSAKAVGVHRNVELQRGLGNGNSNGNGRSALNAGTGPSK